LQSSFAVKTATSSNTSKIEVKASPNAPEGTHLIKIKQLASSQFVTGEKLDTDNNGNLISMNTKLVDLGFDASEGTTIHIKHGDKQVNLDVRENTTVGNLISSLQSAGLNASYDTVQKRFFISSKNSGKENTFEITTSSSEQVQYKNAIRDFIGYDSLSSANKSKVDGYLNSYLDSDLTPEDKNAIKNKLLDIKHQQVRTKYIDDYISSEDNIAAVTPEVVAELEKDLEEGETIDDAVLQAAIKERLRKDAETAVSAEYDEWSSGEAEAGNVFLLAENELNTLLTDYAGASSDPISQTGSLANLGLGEITKNAEGNIEIVGNPNAVLLQATDAIIIYNGAELTGSSNNFTVNGLTLTLKGTTAGLDTAGTEDDEVISLSVSNNAQAVYDTIKDFITKYNEILKEMNDAYYAPSAKGYDPLTDEEKEVMTEDQIDKWEKKIKDSLLRRDDTLGGLINIMRTTLNEGVTVNGKTLSLSSFGISSQNYTEKGILHIYGDEDDEAVSASKNKLMDALNKNPDEVMEVVSKLTDKLYSRLMDKMKSSSLSSALTVYNDKEMDKTLSAYKSDLKRMEKKLADIEDKYYRQFAAMESAMAKINSQNSAMMSMLGLS
jgi:flagellar hook-associated protein 2